MNIMNTLSFKQIVSIAVFAGLLAGLVLTAVQQIQVIPSILEAETYEAAGAIAPVAGHRHEVDTAHDHAAWAPEEGLERTLFTTFANVTIGLGFGLLLVAGVALRGGKINISRGLLWGMAGFAVFFVSPSLGLHPEIPGTESAPLMDRKVWWIATVVCTATGMVFIAFNHHVLAKITGLVLILAPHIVGAPLPDVHASLAPEVLAHQFMTATTIANAAFWLVLGAATGFFYNKFNTPDSV